MTEMCKMSLCRSYGGTGSLKHEFQQQFIKRMKDIHGLNRYNVPAILS
jgi:hypothetical protein